MKKFIPLIMLMMAAPLTARADIIHTISASTQLRVDAALQMQQELVQPTVFLVQHQIPHAGTNGWFRCKQMKLLGGLTATLMVFTPSGGGATTYNQTHAAIIQGDYDETNSIGSFGVDVDTDAHTYTAEVLYNVMETPAINAYKTTMVMDFQHLVTYVTTAGGFAGSLAGTINSGGTITLTAGGAGTTATGHYQHINNQMINEEDTCPDCGCVCPCECEDCDCCARGA